MVQYTVKMYTNGILDQEVSNLSLHEAYTVCKPPPMNPHNDRWHVMMYLAVVDKMAVLPNDESLLVAWEEEMGTMPCRYHYISVSQSSD